MPDGAERRPVACAFHGVAGRLAARISVANAATVDSEPAVLIY